MAANEVLRSVRPARLQLPVDPPTLARLQGRACITCGTTTGPLTPIGHVYTTDEGGGGRLGWAVVACPEHAGGAA